MAIVMECSAVATVRRGRLGEALPSRAPLTLADVITAVQDVVGPEDEGLAVATVWHLPCSGRLTVFGPSTRQCPPRCQQALSALWWAQ
jgi:hypothetical protein